MRGRVNDIKEGGWRGSIVQSMSDDHCRAVFFIVGMNQSSGRPASGLSFQFIRSFEKARKSRPKKAWTPNENSMSASGRSERM
jgi:hypothetical protein